MAMPSQAQRSPCRSRDHEKYKNLSAKDLGKKYQGFYTDSRTSDVLRTSRPINKAHQYHHDEKQKNMTKAGEWMKGVINLHKKRK